MRVALFMFAVAFGLLALASRHRLNRELDPDDDSDSAQVEQTLRTSSQAKQSLNDAITRISQAQNRKPGPAAPTTPGRPAMPAPAGGNDQLTNEVNGWIKQMQDNPDQAFNILQTALNATNGPEAAQMRLSLLQTALGLSGDENLIKDIALREMTATIVEPQNDNMDPSMGSLNETRRMIVSTSFKLYLNASHDAETTYSDVGRILSYQRDQATKDLVIYDAVSRFPELRERLLGPNP